MLTDTHFATWQMPSNSIASAEAIVDGFGSGGMRPKALIRLLLGQGIDTIPVSGLPFLLCIVRANKELVVHLVFCSLIDMETLEIQQVKPLLLLEGRGTEKKQGV